MNLENLEKRLRVLEAKDEINDLMYHYLNLSDVSETPGEIADFFTEDAVYETGGYLSEMPPTVGRDAIRELFRGVRNILTFSIHYATNSRIQVAEDGLSASGSWYTYEIATTANDREEVILHAVYENDFVYTDDGWKISKILFSDVLSFPFKEGWKDIRFISLVDSKKIYHDK